MPGRDDFHKILIQCFDEAERSGKKEIVLTAGQVHRLAGGYPGPSHRMPVCCSTMKQLMKGDDELLYAPPSGKGASLEIRYQLPRTGKTTDPVPPAPRERSRPAHTVAPLSPRSVADIQGKVVCFLPCCGGKDPSGIAHGETFGSPDIPEPTASHLADARQRGGFSFNTNGPATAALDLYTGSPYQAFSNLQSELYLAMSKGTFHLYILSAGYGLIDAREAIHNYNEEMKGATATHWRDHHLEDRIAEILIHEAPDRFYGYFAAEPFWSHASSKYRYFFTEGAKRAIHIGLKVSQAGCFFRSSGRGVKAILNGLGRTFAEHFAGGFDPQFAERIDETPRQDGEVIIEFDRFR